MLYLFLHYSRPRLKLSVIKLLLFQHLNCETNSLTVLKVTGMHCHFKKLIWNTVLPFCVTDVFPLLVLCVGCFFISPACFLFCHPLLLTLWTTLHQSGLHFQSSWLYTACHFNLEWNSFKWSEKCVFVSIASWDLLKILLEPQ